MFMGHLTRCNPSSVIKQRTPYLGVMSDVIIRVAFSDKLRARVVWNRCRTKVVRHSILAILSTKLVN